MRAPCKAAPPLASPRPPPPSSPGIAPQQHLAHLHRAHECVLVKPVPEIAPRKSAFALVLLVLVAVATSAWWWLERNTRPAPRPVPVINTPGAIAQTTTPDAPATDPATPPATSDTATPPAATETLPAPPDPLPTAGDILAQPEDDLAIVAKKLSAVVTDTRQPLSERTEALAHTLNLSAGNEAAILRPLVENAELPPALTATILDESLNRPLRVQADLYHAALAAQKNPELLTKIREHLAFLTNGPDLGADPRSWTKALEAARATWPE